MENHKEIVDIIKKYDIGSTNSPFYWPNIKDQSKKNIVKNVDNNILLDSVLAVFDTTLMGKNCKNGLVFTLSGFYNIELYEKPLYVNYPDIEAIEVTADKKGRVNSGDAKVTIFLKNNTSAIVSNACLVNKMNLKELLEELIIYSSTWDSKSYGKSSGKVEKLPLAPDIRKKCNIIIHSASVASGGVGTGLAQIPLSDTLIITPIQIGMIISLAAVFGLKITREFANSLLAGFSASIGGRAVSQVLVGWIPGFGNAINTVTAAVITEAIGWSVVEGFYKQDQDNRAKYALEGQKKGYIFASAEYEYKLKVQAELFENQERNFKKEAESYELLLKDYENYIEELETKDELSVGDQTALEETKVEYQKLKSLSIQ